MLLLLLFATFLQSICSFNILMYSTPVGFSHVQFSAKICETLVRNGHNVTMLFPVLEDNMKKHACKGANIVFMDLPNWIKEKQKKRAAGFWQIGPLLSNLHIISRIASIQHDVCEHILENRHSLSFYNETFDVGIADINGMCAFGLFKEINIKSKIATSAIGFMDGISPAFHTPVQYSYVPGTLLYYHENMTFLQRMLNLIWNLTSTLSYKYLFIGKYEKFFAKHGINFDFQRDLEEDYNYFLLNTNEFLDVARPISARMMYIGGIAVGEPGELPEEFDKLLSLSEKGTVVISFGSYAPTSDMPKEMMDSFIGAIRELKDYTFIWKTDDKALTINEGIPNLYTVKWIPQRELLNDSRVKVFISHAGMNSLLETATAGKPTIFVPIFGDQFQLTDFASMLISLFSLYIAGRKPSQRMSFGFHRAEVLGAFFSVFLIWIVTGILVILAIMRIVNGNYEVDAPIMAVTAGLGVLVNIVMGGMLYFGGHSHSHSHGGGGHGHAHSNAHAEGAHGHCHNGADDQNINVRAAFIHVLGDLIQSIGVLIAALIIYFKNDWAIVDPICTLMFSVIVLCTTIYILSRPSNINFSQVFTSLEQIPGVRKVHDLRIWALTMDKVAISVHLEVEDTSNAQIVLRDTRMMLQKNFGVHESTVQIEGFAGRDDCGRCDVPK